MVWTPRTLKGQLTLLFLALTLLPSLALTALVASRLLDAVGRWEQPGVRRALTGSFELAQDMIDRAENELLQRGQVLATDPRLQRSLTEAGVREQLATSTSFDFLQVYDTDGNLVFETTRDALIAAPGPLPGALEAAGTADPFLRILDRGILAHTGYLGDPERGDRILVVGNFLGQDFYGKLEDLSDAVAYYHQLRTFIRIEQRGVILLLILVVIMLSALAVLTARLLASRVSHPVVSLGHGMNRVASGEAPVHVTPEGPSETEQLIRTFNAMSRELSRSREKLAQAERQTAWRDMARRVAHEMRNALTPIAFSVHRLRKAEAGLPSGERERFSRSLGSVLEEVEGLKRLAASFSELARLPVPEIKPFDLGEMITSTVNAGASESLRIDWTPPAEPVMIEGDRSLLRQALTNLLRNASEAMEGSGDIRVRMEAEGERVQLVVDDDGPGWPEGDRNQFTEPYVTTKSAGTGLGLSLVQRTVFQHGGTLELGDAPGRGARVTLELPTRSLEGEAS